jgi:hypothetical protein
MSAVKPPWKRHNQKGPQMSEFLIFFAIVSIFFITCILIGFGVVFLGFWLIVWFEDPVDTHIRHTNRRK